MPGVERSKFARRGAVLLVVAGALLVVPPLLKRLHGPAAQPTSMPMHARARPIADLSFTDGQGRPTSLAAFRGRTVLLNLWATWCTPCRDEMPALDRLQAALGGPGFEVVALSIDDGGLPLVRSFYETLKIRWLKPYLHDGGDATAGLASTGIPLTLLIDADGREIGRRLGPAAWDDPAMVALLRSRIAGSAQPHRAGTGVDAVDRPAPTVKP